LMQVSNNSGHLLVPLPSVIGSWRPSYLSP
jgi:hypothetical protein